VEDHAPSRLSLGRLLEKRGYTVQTAGSIAQARAVLGKGDFDLLLSDVGLPDGNPYELMRDLADHRGIPGVALSGYGMESDLQQSVAAGFSAHLIKPITAQALDDVLARLFAQLTPKGGDACDRTAGDC
jgi:CheY-like chemotaxis protein